jgi:hypothetical protein
MVRFKRARLSQRVERRKGGSIRPGGASVARIKLPAPILMCRRRPSTTKTSSARCVWRGEIARYQHRRKVPRLASRSRGSPAHTSGLLFIKPVNALYVGLMGVPSSMMPYVSFPLSSRYNMTDWMFVSLSRRIELAQLARDVICPIGLCPLRTRVPLADDERHAITRLAIGRQIEPRTLAVGGNSEDIAVNFVIMPGGDVSTNRGVTIAAVGLAAFPQCVGCADIVHAKIDAALRRRLY